MIIFLYFVKFLIKIMKKRKKSLKKCLTILFAYDRIAPALTKTERFLNLVNMDEETDARTAVDPKDLMGCCASGTIKTKSVYKLCTG